MRLLFESATLSEGNSLFSLIHIPSPEKFSKLLWVSLTACSLSCVLCAFHFEWADIFSRCGRVPIIQKSCNHDGILSRTHAWCLEHLAFNLISSCFSFPFIALTIFPYLIPSLFLFLFVFFQMLLFSLVCIFFLWSSCHLAIFRITFLFNVCFTSTP